MNLFKLLVCVWLSFASPITAINFNFELWNKHTEPVYYSIGDSAQELQKKPFEFIKPGKWAQKKVSSSPKVIAIAVGKEPTPGQRVDLYSMHGGKTYYLRVGLPAEKEKIKEKIKDILGRASFEGDNYIFGAQVGPLLGIKGVTEHGYPLENNITKDEMSKSSMIYLPK